MTRCLTLLLLLLLPAAAYAQNVPEPIRGVQVFNGFIIDKETTYFDVYDLRPGQIIYIYAEATSGNLDTYIELGNLNFSEVYARDDDGAGGTNSRLSFVVPAGGDYSISISSFDPSTSHEYRLIIAVDVPEAFTGNVEPSGNLVLERYRGFSGEEAPPPRCETLQPRPRLSGPVSTYETLNFIIHYTTEGIDAAEESFIEELALTLEITWNHHIVRQGWPIPPSDCGEGGDERFDVYVREVLSEGILGFATQQGVVGNNANTIRQIERYAAYSYLTIDNDFAGMEDPGASMRSTVAHEFMHNIQFGLDMRDEYFGIYEASASYIETITFPNDEDATRYVIEVFETPDLCLGNNPRDLPRRIYGEWLMIDSIVQDFGEEAHLQIWRDIGVQEGITGFYESLRRLGTTPQEVVERMAVRHLLRDYTMSYRFEDQVTIDSAIEAIGAHRSAGPGVQELAVNFVRIDLDGRYTYTIDQPDLSLYAIGINSERSEARVFDLGQSGTLDNRAFSDTYLIVLNTLEHSSPAVCRHLSWTIFVDEGGSNLIPPLPEVWDARNFRPSG